jgi:hypothetical protein
MLKLDDLLEMWKKDSHIDPSELDEASLASARLHSKYLEFYNIYRLSLKKQDNNYNILLKDKWLWYNGKMTQDEMDKLGWEYDPLNKMKIMKSDMERFYKADPDIIAFQEKMEYTKSLLDTTKEIMESVKWRHQSIKNAIEWRKFTSGG